LGLAIANRKVKNAPRLYYLDQNHWTTVEAVLAHLGGKPPKINLVEEPLYSWYFAYCFGEFRFKAGCAIPGWGVPDHIQEITHQFTNPQEAGTFHHLFVYSTGGGSTTSSYKHNTVSGGTATNYVGVAVPPLCETEMTESSSPHFGGSTTSSYKHNTESGGTATNCAGLAVPPPTPTHDREVAPPKNGSTTPMYITNNGSGATCDALPLLNPGDEVDVYFYSSWCRATVLDCLLDGDFLVRAHIHLYDKTIGIYDAGSLRLPQDAASLTGATAQ